jgi:hypothetical protein
VVGACAIPLAMPELLILSRVVGSALASTNFPALIAFIVVRFVQLKIKNNIRKN